MILISCDSDHGIGLKQIEDTEFGFGGNIVFYGAWPDSVKRVFIIAFKDTLITLDNLGFISDSLTLGIQTYKYSSLDSAIIPLIQFEIPPSVYKYVAVVQQSTVKISLDRKDWFVTGVYYANGAISTPGILTIPEDTFVDDINIYCDFDNPPPQPPGGN
jgi:hypothetical protein